jgi:hypothetical protein
MMMGNDNATISDDDSARSLSPSEPPRLQNVSPMKLWLDLSDILQEYDDLRGITDLSELNKRLNWKGVCTIQELNIEQRAERHRVRAQIELARKAPDAECDPDIGVSFRSLRLLARIRVIDTLV